MEWLFVVVMMTSEGNDRHTLAKYSIESECVVAAEAFVARYPAFEFRHGADDNVIEPVVRSYVECLPETQDPKD
jgi:hypothetical protein